MSLLTSTSSTCSYRNALLRNFSIEILSNIVRNDYHSEIHTKVERTMIFTSTIENIMFDY